MTSLVPDPTRRDNTLAIVDTLRNQGPMARIDLGTANGISSATVTAITTELLRHGLVSELPAEPHRQGGRGRPKTLIRLEPEAAHVVCVKLSLNEVQVVAGDFAGQVRHAETHSLTTATLTPDTLCDVLEEHIQAVSAALPGGPRRLDGICLAIQGVVSPASGMLIWSPALRFRNTPLTGPLAERLGCPVMLENDTNCIASILARQPAYADTPNLAVIMLGYGIGMSVLIDGRPLLGANGSAAEIGHSKFEPGGALCACGRRGCIEAYASDYALYREAHALLSLPPGDSAHPSEAQMQALVRLAEQGDPVARQIYHKAGRALGYGIANVLALFNPDLVLVTGSGVRGYAAMQPALEAAIDEALVPELVGASRLATHPWDRDMTCLGGIGLILEATDPMRLTDLSS
ncbi:ROK family transcriptional regulator [Billgrantia gudaonensis]|uniref:Sugar kinase of the NBD/HSP70 family, may contain an N-terminal HTH domain n=1 Tax=Billgrantia gudaonensis TaxID=376427 RepID=A0A1G9CMQ4_9GAMM|nr:ROK family transcriptional regulator [Halomonas gudaonensis]SDK52970.1 Sugar kinase of the NBD/HSP70 family, may contain an N-terminal HTH domain [Halomonas gudaonensis]